MKKTILHFLFVGLMVMAPDLIYGQCDDAVGGFVSSSDSTRCVGEKTELLLTGYSGSITWESSPAGADTWTVFTTKKNNRIKVYPTTDTDYRAFLDTDDPCTDAYSSVLTIDVLTTGFESASGFSDEPCGVTFFLSAEGVNPGIWSKKTGPGIVGYFPGNDEPDVSVVVDTYGDYVFAFTNGFGGCAAVNIETFEQNTALATDSIEYCGAFREPFNLKSSLSNPKANGYWTRIGSSYTIDDVQDTNALITPDNQGVFSIRWTETYGDCYDDTTVTFSTFVQPDAAATNVDDVCDSVETLNATPVLRHTKQYWQQLSGSGTLAFSDSSIVSPEVEASVYDNYSIEWVVENNFCVDNDIITVNFLEQPLANAGDSPDVCGDTAYLNAYSSVGVGQWRYYSGPQAPLFENTSGSSTWVYNNGIYDTYSLIWEETNSICVDSDTLTFSFYEQPQSDAGLPESVCDITTVLSATSSVGIGTWTVIPDLGNIDIESPASPLSNITTDQYGIYELQWKEVNAICSDSSQVTISFFEQPVANAGLGGDTCGLRFSLDAIISVSGASGNWYQETGGGSVGFTPDNSSSTVAEVSETGNYSFAWVERNDICIDTSSTITVEFLEVPIANPGMGGDACALSIQLTAQDLGVPGVWSSNSSINFSPDNTTAQAIASVSDTGIYILNWRVDNGSCASDSSITLHYRLRPTVSVEPKDDVCGDTTTLSGTFNVGIGQWSVLQGADTDPFSNIHATSPKVTVSEFGDYIFQWQASNGECRDSATVQMNFFEIPDVDAGPDDKVCGNYYLLNANTTSGSGMWFLESGSGTVSFTPDASTPDAEIDVTESGIYTFIRRNNNFICEDQDSISIEFVKMPSAIIDSITPLFNAFETPVTAAEINEIETGQWSVLFEGTGVFSSVSNPNTGISNLSLGENIIQWEVSNDICSDIDSALIMVYDIFVPAVITPNNDGSNDSFTILGIEDIEGAELIVYNRWGVEVYSNPNYENDNNWAGTNKSGVVLTNDTYFYVLVVENRPIRDFVVIKR